MNFSEQWAAELVERGVRLDVSVQELTFAVINCAGRKYRGHQTRMALALGISRVTLCKTIALMRVRGEADGWLQMRHGTQTCRRGVPRAATGKGINE